MRLIVPSSVVTEPSGLEQSGTAAAAAGTNEKEPISKGEEALMASMEAVGMVTMQRGAVAMRP